MKCSICGSISMNDKFCGVCGTRFDTKPEEPTPVLSREKMRGSGRTAVKFLFWIALVPLGWLIFNTDFTDLLAGLRLPYVYAFPFTGFALIVIGAPMALITIWDSLSSLVPDGFYRRAHSAREEWKNLGTLARFLVISTVGELAILGLGWTIWVALGIDYHASIAIILAVVLQ